MVGWKVTKDTCVSKPRFIRLTLVTMEKRHKKLGTFWGKVPQTFLGKISQILPCNWVLSIELKGGGVEIKLEVWKWGSVSFILQLILVNCILTHKDHIRQSSILMLIYYFTPLQNDSIVTSQCMQSTFGDKREFYLLDERSIGPRMKYSEIIYSCLKWWK